MRKSGNYQTGDQALVRQINLSLVLRILHAEAPLSRARLSEKTRLNKTTVSDLINELMEQGFVRELGMRSSGTGRPGTLLTLNPDAGYIVSAEIGVDYLEVLVTDFAPEVIWQVKEPILPETSQDAILERVLALLHQGIERRKSETSRLLGIAVGVPGMVDLHSGTILFAPNLKWRNVPLLALLEKENFGAPVFVDNEANLSALGEYYFGAAQGFNEILYLSGSMGLGGGFLRNGQLCRGANGVAAEYGHMTIDPQGELCNCGNSGCWETLVSQKALFKKIIQHLESDQSHSQLATQLETLSVERVVDAAESGDALAVQALQETGRSLGIGIASLLNALNPEIVVFGGALSVAAKFLFPMAEIEIQKRALPWNRATVKIVRAAHGADACVKGGVAAVYHAVLSKSPVISSLSR